MKYTDFQNLVVLSAGVQTEAEQIAKLSAGDYFLFSSQEWQKGGYVAGSGQGASTGAASGTLRKGTDRRHKVHYQRKVDPIDAYGITGPAVGYVPEYDVLESDNIANETKTAVRRGQEVADSRDDDDRNGRIINDPDWS